MSSDADASSEEKKEEEASQSWASWASWGQDVLKNITEKSSSTLGMMKKDLSEFYSTIQSDTAAVVADTANKVQETLAEEEEDVEDHSALKSVKQGFSTVLTKFSDSIKHLAEAGAQTTFMIDDRKDRGSSMTQYDRKEAIIFAVQTDPGTFCNEPDGLVDAFSEWLETFDIESYRGEISDLLVQNTDIRAMYIKLVPIVVPHLTFWQRYYYKLYQVDQEESRRAALVARASAEHHREESYSWGDDDDDLPDRVLETQPDEVKVSSSAEETVIKEGDKKLAKEEESTSTDSQSESNTDIVVDTSKDVDVSSKDFSDSKDGVEKSNVIEIDTPTSASDEKVKDEPPMIRNDVTEDVEGLSEEVTVSSCTENADSQGTSDQPAKQDEDSKAAASQEEVEDDDFDLDMDLDADDEEINEEELAEMISKIKSDPAKDGDEDDDDWESWQ